MSKIRNVRSSHFQVSAAALAAAIVFVVLVGCGGQGANNASESEEQAAQAEAAQPGKAAKDPGVFSKLLGEPAKKTVTLSAGERIEVQTTNTLSTKSTQSGETFYGHLTKALTVNGVEVAPAGSQVTGQVTSADKGGRVKGVASLALVLNEIKTPSGMTIPIETQAFVAQAKKTPTKDAQKIGIGAGVGAAIGAIAGGGSGALKGAGVGAGAGTGTVLATHGDAAVIPAESVIWFSLANPVSVTL